MTRIDSAAQLAALIRRQVATLRAPARSGQALASPDGESAKSSKPTSAESADDVAGLISRRVRSIDPDDPQRARKAFRVFLESVLLSELGDGLINDPGFYQMVDHVQNQMEADPHLAQAIREAAAVLLSERSPE